MTASPRRWAVHDRRRPVANPRWSRYSVSTASNGLRFSGRDSIPCLAKLPTLCSTWQRPQIPRPPQTESMSTPRDRAASRTVVPVGNRPRRPDGVKMTSASSATVTVPLADRDGAAIDPATADLALGDGHPMGADPARAIGVVAHQDVGGHDAG